MKTLVKSGFTRDRIDATSALVQLALDKAKASGASAAEASALVAHGLSVAVRQGEIETVEHNEDNSISVTVYYGDKLGSASTTDLEQAAVIKAVEAACAIAQHTAEDSCFGLADTGLLASEIPDLDLYEPNSITIEQAIDSAKACEQIALDSDSRITNSEGASLSMQEGLDVYGNTNGFLHGLLRSRYSKSCSVIAQDASGMQRDYWYDTRRHFSDLESDASIGQKTAHRTLRRLGATKLSTRQAPVIFEAPVASSLVSHFLSAISGGNLYRQSSFLLDHLGKAVFPEYLSIEELPHIPRALASSPYDNEGVVTNERTLVQAGVLQGYLLSSYTARKLGMQTTGNAGGPHNVIMSHGESDLAGLLRSMDTGLLVTELIGYGINSVTGDYSRGAAGFWVERGEIQYPVDEITIAGNLRTIYQDIVSVGNDIDTRGTIRCGSVLIGNMTIAGN
ncbi:MAG: metalloprotease PmbA [Gammaproteobacteria bacterium]|nr:MAG: metalloprotease PmbA [Gammaproteobacteria bacterium]